mmetsp:Transcript_22919/g.31883  ORF Transcript_22919/g.31883 Transcript_22919/m.31883 type:complete len:327 (+) Transcript_22919:2-982(+)
MGDNLPAADLGTGRTVVLVSAGSYHTCAMLDDRSLKCWGRNTYGQLGLGELGNRGDSVGEMGDNLPAVDLGTGRTAAALSGGGELTCAVLDEGSLKCWGRNDRGQLGLGDTNTRGNSTGQMGDSLPIVDLGTERTAMQVSAGGGFACAVLDNASVKCWGANDRGQLGLEDTKRRGDAPGEMGDNLPAVSLGTGQNALRVSLGTYHVCATIEDFSSKCWGSNSQGQLGLGDINHRGDVVGEMGDNLPSAITYGLPPPSSAPTSFTPTVTPTSSSPTTSTPTTVTPTSVPTSALITTLTSPPPINAAATHYCIVLSYYVCIFVSLFYV